MKNFTPTPKEHVFFSSMAVIIVALILLGFSNTYLPKIIHSDHTVPKIIHYHALVFVLWIGFFLFQVSLILRNKVSLHKKLGPYGVVFSFIMLLAGCAASIEVAKLGHKGIPGVEFQEAAGFLLLNFLSLFAFVSLTILGWYNRNNSPAHKRFMLMANAGGLAPPGIARLPFLAGSTPGIAIVVLLLILSGPVYDLIRYRKIHWAYLVGILFIVLTLPPIVIPLSSTGLWKDIASFLTQF